MGKRKWIAIWFFVLIFFCLALWDFYTAFILVGNPASFISKRLILFYLTLPFLAGFALFWMWSILTGRFSGKIFSRIISFIWKIKPAIRWAVSGLFIIAPSYLLIVSPVGDYHPGYWFRFVLVTACAFFAAFLSFPEKIDLSWLVKFSAAIMAAAVVLVTWDWLKSVNSYPFSLTWSEGNRMWDYSMLFGSSRYLNPGGAPIFTFIETGRQVLWALPFLLQNLSIFGFRLWNALVWILPPIILAACSIIGKPFSAGKWLWQAGFVLWGYLFLSQGPIYPPLLLSAALVVVAVRQKNLFLAAVLTAVAAYYCRESRWTWMYAPGLWAALLVLLNQNNPSFSRDGWKKLIPSIILGLSGFIGGQYLSPLINIFVNGVSQTALQGTAVVLPELGIQAMLWDRLFPNPTFPPGILLGIIWVGLPAVLFIFGLWKTKVWKPNWVQLLCVAGLLGLFLVLGIFVSVKIGGGSNLHNLDMFLVTVAVVAGFLFNKWKDSGQPDPFTNRKLMGYLMVAMILPASVMIQYGEPLRLPSGDLTAKALAVIQDEVKAKKDLGPVLFIDQRQLLTFGYVKDVPLVADYEKKYVMDQSLSGNEPYFKEFENRLSQHTYALIVTEPISGMQADQGLKNFAEENNAWVEWVSMPLIKYYRPIFTDKTIGVQLLVPKE